MNKHEITAVEGREVLDSRGNPTIGVRVATASGVGEFLVPSGASTGKYEAHEMRDEDGGMSKALASLSEVVAPALIEKDASNQKGIDEFLEAIDGTRTFETIGANVAIGVSLATSRAVADGEGIELYEYLQTLLPGNTPSEGTRLVVNLINGGAHAENSGAVQEHHVIPLTSDVGESLAMASDVERVLHDLLDKRGVEYTHGSEGGVAFSPEGIMQPFEFLREAVERSGHAGAVELGADIAASELFEGGQYTLYEERHSAEKLMSLYHEMRSTYGVMYLEDPFEQNDFEAFSQLSAVLPNALIVGDDLTVSSCNLLEAALAERSINAIIIKPNQAGTLTRTLATISRAHEAGIKVVVSHRSGETMDTYIADLAYAAGAYALKAGAPRSAERRVKYDRLLGITTNNG